MAKGLRGNGYKVKNLTREQCISMINNILRESINKINCMEMLLNMTSMALFCQSLNGGMEILSKFYTIIETIKKKENLKERMEYAKIKKDQNIKNNLLVCQFLNQLRVYGMKSSVCFEIFQKVSNLIKY